MVWRHRAIGSRAGVFALCLVVVGALGPGTAWSNDASGNDGIAAREAVRSIADRALAILKRTDATGREAAFLQLFREEFAIGAIGRFLLGAYRTSVTPAQFARYQTVLETLVAKTTAARLSGYAGEGLEVLGARAEGTRWLVTSRVVPKTGEPVRLDWVLARASAGLKVVDLRVENLSLAITERDEFASVLQANGGDIDRLIVFMQDKIRKLDAGEERAIAPARPRSPP
jgi:phospholipid transport system substrate-binding protein